MSTTEPDWWDRITVRVTGWHHGFFPGVAPELVALKLCEEAGEVARAVGNLVTGTRAGTAWRTETALELADVVITAMSVADRLGIDLRGAVTDRVEVVTARRRDSAKEHAR